MESTDVNLAMDQVRDRIFALERQLQEAQEALGRDKGGRELAVAITQLQTSRMWLGAALETRGYYEAQTNE